MSNNNKIENQVPLNDPDSSNEFSKPKKKQITINLSKDAVIYFRKEAARTGLPYQTLINLYLTDCAQKKRTINISE